MKTGPLYNKINLKRCYIMKKMILLPMAILITAICGGCNLFVTPPQGPVYVNPGETISFMVYAIPETEDISWFFDAEEVQAGGSAFEYTRPEGDLAGHVLEVNILGAFGLTNFTWDIQVDTP